MNVCCKQRGTARALIRASSNSKHQQRTFLASDRTAQRFDPQILGDLSRSNPQVGQVAYVDRTFSQQDVEAYQALVGDYNPLHQSWTKETLPDELQGHPLLHWHDDSSSRSVVHGMLVASLFTCIFGQQIPGAVYLQQSLRFRQPVWVGDPIRGQITVTDVQGWKRGQLLVCETTVTMETQQQQPSITGTAKVWLPSPG